MYNRNIDRVGVNVIKPKPVCRRHQKHSSYNCNIVGMCFLKSVDIQLYHNSGIILTLSTVRPRHAPNHAHFEKWISPTGCIHAVPKL